MSIYYNSQTKGFYPSEVFDVIPEGSVEITEEEWLFLLNEQSKGKQITSDENGYPIIVDVPGPTKEQTIEMISFAIQNELDIFAQSWGYDNILSGVSYASSTNPQFSADANSLSTWRDQVWSWAIPKFDTVYAGQTPESFMVDMPQKPLKPSV